MKNKSKILARVIDHINNLPPAKKTMKDKAKPDNQAKVNLNIDAIYKRMKNTDFNARAFAAKLTESVGAKLEQSNTLEFEAAYKKKWEEQMIDQNTVWRSTAKCEPLPDGSFALPWSRGEYLNGWTSKSYFEHDRE